MPPLFSQPIQGFMNSPAMADLRAPGTFIGLADGGSMRVSAMAHDDAWAKGNSPGRTTTREDDIQAAVDKLPVSKDKDDLLALVAKLKSGQGWTAQESARFALKMGELDPATPPATPGIAAGDPIGRGIGDATKSRLDDLSAKSKGASDTDAAPLYKIAAKLSNGEAVSGAEMDTLNKGMDGLRDKYDKIQAVDPSGYKRDEKVQHDIDSIKTDSSEKQDMISLEKKLQSGGGWTVEDQRQYQKDLNIAREKDLANDNTI